MYRIHRPFRVPLHVLVPTYNKIMGVEQKSFTDVGLVFVSMHGMRTEEKDIDNLEKVSDIRICQSMYSSLIRSGVRLVDVEKKHWEVIGEPEDLREGGHFLQFKIRRIACGA